MFFVNRVRVYLIIFLPLRIDRSIYIYIYFKSINLAALDMFIPLDSSHPPLLSQVISDSTPSTPLR